MADKPEDNKLGITSLIDGAKASQTKPVVTKVKSKGFVRVKYVKGRPYYYLVRSYRENGKVKQEVLKYLGTRKPRGKLATPENDPGLLANSSVNKLGK